MVNLVIPFLSTQISASPLRILNLNGPPDPLRPGPKPCDSLNIHLALECAHVLAKRLDSLQVVYLTT